MVDKIPLQLFHYTSPEGLCGILQQKKIFATEIRYLNDAQEFEYALAFAIDTIEALRKRYPADARTFLDASIKVLRQLREEMEETGEVPIFVCSFSSKGNLLSQWRGYCPNANGYSLGFDFIKLKNLARQHNLSLSKCLYKESDQVSEIKKILDASLGVFQARQAEPSDEPADVAAIALKEAGKDFVQRFLQIAPTLKDKQFGEESEWRLTSLDPDGATPLHFRSGKSTLIPYVEFPLTDKDGAFPLTRIYVGPTPMKELSKHSVKHLLRANRIEGCAVVASNIPYRSW